MGVTSGRATKEWVARRKLSLLDLACELEILSRARRVMGSSRQRFYEILAETQRDLGAFSAVYNSKPPHRGRGSTPAKTAKVDRTEGRKTVSSSTRARGHGAAVLGEYSLCTTCGNAPTTKRRSEDWTVVQI